MDRSGSPVSCLKFRMLASQGYLYIPCFSRTHTSPSPSFSFLSWVLHIPGNMEVTSKNELLFEASKIFVLASRRWADKLTTPSTHSPSVFSEPEPGMLQWLEQPGLRCACELALQGQGAHLLCSCLYPNTEQGSGHTLGP